MKDSNSSIQRNIPDNWKINLQDYKGLDQTLSDLIAQGTSFLSYTINRCASASLKRTGWPRLSS
jgi:hypothetical protein